MENKTLAEKAGKKDSYEGDFVLESQKTHEAFTHVNEDWLKKSPTFEQVLKQGKEYQERFEDIDGKTLGALSSSEGRLSFGKLGKSTGGIHLTDHAASQLGTALDIPGRYLRTLLDEDKELFDHNVNRRVKSLDSKEAEAEKFLRFRKNEDGSRTLRALLTSRYAVINNLPIIETLNDIVPGGRASHLHYDGDTFRANILIPDTLRKEDDSDYGGGISVINNETGRFAYRQRPFVFRAICCNGNVWGRKDGFEFNRRHLGTIDWKEFRKSVILNLQKQIPLVQENINKILALKGIPVTEQDIQQAIVYVGRREQLTKGVQIGWYQGFQTELKAAKSAKDILSAFGLVQGLTRTAQEQPGETQELLETLSARLTDGNWDRTFVAARNAVEADVAKKVLVPEVAKK